MRNTQSKLVFCLFFIFILLYLWFLCLFFFLRYHSALYHTYYSFNNSLLDISICHSKDRDRFIIVKQNFSIPIWHYELKVFIEKWSNFCKYKTKLLWADRVVRKVFFQNSGDFFHPESATRYYYSLRLIYIRTYNCKVMSFSTVSNIYQRYCKFWYPKSFAFH